MRIKIERRAKERLRRVKKMRRVQVKEEDRARAKYRQGRVKEMLRGGVKQEDRAERER